MSDSGCGCRVAGARGSEPRAVWALAMLGVALGGLRSRARKRALQLAYAVRAGRPPPLR